MKDPKISRVHGYVLVTLAIIAAFLSFPLVTYATQF
jgi:hypothetical protein